MVVDIRQLVQLARQEGASDLHLSVGIPPCLRINGSIIEAPGYPPLSPDDTERCLAQITTPAQREDLALHRELDLAWSLDGVAQMRVNASYQRDSFSLAVRLLNDRIPTIDELGLPQILKNLAERSHGMVLVTGTTGSGKSTTLAALIEHINQSQRRRIVTIEDPIEYIFASKSSVILQRQVGRDTLSFAEALRRVLRQDPDVIVVGEMRDLETMSVALSAAETGHLVLATLHTINASQTIDRIIDAFPPEQQQQVRVQLAEVLEAIISQALLPKQDGTGRVAIHEILTTTDAIRNLIRKGATEQIPTYMNMGQKDGMQTFEQSVTQLADLGLISEEVALSRTSKKLHLE